METEFLLARIKDTAEICLRTSKPKFLGFLSAEQAKLAEQILTKQVCDFSFFGGFPEAERVFLGCFPEWDEQRSFPVSALTLGYRAVDKPSHRDFLGSLMALGIKRESVGDILVGESRTVIFVSDDIRNYILTQVEKIGKTGVSVTEGFTLPLPLSDTLASFSDTVSSPRLDCIVSALGGFSRSDASGIIANGLVSLNSVVTEKATKVVSENDIITIRGKGKFIIESLDGRTKKNRVILNYKKYI